MYFFADLIGSHGDFVHYRGVLNFYLINDAELVAHVFKQTHRQFNKETPVYRRFHRALGNSLIASEGGELEAAAQDDDTDLSLLRR